MLIVLDNYDSFTFNLVQYLGELGEEVRVVRNDAMSADALLAQRPDHIVISPGPGRPEEAGQTLEVVRKSGNVPLLGVCLGHQAIGLAFGGVVTRGRRPVHGKASAVDHDGRGVFAGVGQGFAAGRYHSLVVQEDGLPSELEVSARAHDDGAVMGLRHRHRPVHGVQFHPESVLTTSGRQILRNFLALGRRSA
jgi:anthranilate synthase component II